jgi:general nucleoside transport system permease protein
VGRAVVYKRCRLGLVRSPRHRRRQTANGHESLAPKLSELADDTLRAITAPPGGRVRGVVRTTVAVAATAGILAVVVAALGADPASAFRALITGALGTKFNFGQTVMITSLLALTGLAAAIPFTAHLWNVGGEGQLYFGAFTAAAVSLTLPADLPHWFFAPLVIVACIAGGAAWGFVPGVLKAVANANEVITSLMMTFIAILLVNYAITVLWPEGALPQTKYVPATATLPNIWSGTLITAGALIAVGAVFVAWLVMSRTSLGFQIRAIGLNPNASRLNGMSVGRVSVVAFMLGGAFAGLAGGINVLGMNSALITGFSGNFGFLGIAVALVARLSAAWIIPSAFFFAVLRVGSNGLQVETGLSSSVGEVLVATFIFLLLNFHVIRLRYAEAAQ